VPKDEVAAVAHFRRAALAAEPLAMDSLAYHLYRGYGCAKDTAEALTRARKAAQLGERSAMEYCADWSTDDAERRSWWRAAALAGSEKAKRRCAELRIPLQ
jgi:TPR repeat protein